MEFTVKDEKQEILIDIEADGDLSFPELTSVTQFEKELLVHSMGRRSLVAEVYEAWNDSAAIVLFKKLEPPFPVINCFMIALVERMQPVWRAMGRNRYIPEEYRNPNLLTGTLDLMRLFSMGMLDHHVFSKRNKLFYRMEHDINTTPDPLDAIGDSDPDYPVLLDHARYTTALWVAETIAHATNVMTSIDREPSKRSMGIRRRMAVVTCSNALVFYNHAVNAGYIKGDRKEVVEAEELAQISSFIKASEAHQEGDPCPYLGY